MRCASEPDLELLTIDGTGGATGISPWNMMNEWGTPRVTGLPLLTDADDEATALGGDTGRPDDD